MMAEGNEQRTIPSITGYEPVRIPPPPSPNRAPAQPGPVPRWAVVTIVVGTLGAWKLLP